MFLRRKNIFKELLLSRSILHFEGLFPISIFSIKSMDSLKPWYLDILLVFGNLRTNLLTLLTDSFSFSFLGREDSKSSIDSNDIHFQNVEHGWNIEANLEEGKS